MRTLRDNWKRTVTLSEASEKHILRNHPELESRISRIGETIQQPDRVTLSKFDPRSRVFYRYYRDWKKMLCVVVKYLDDEGWVQTAYPTRNIR